MAIEATETPENEQEGNPLFPQRRGFAPSHVHIGLAIGCIIMAAGAFVAQQLHLIDSSGALIFAIVVGLMLLPLVFVDPLHGVMVYAVIAPFSPEADVADIRMRVQDPLAAIMFLGVIIFVLRRGTGDVPLRMRKLLFFVICYALLTTFVGLQIKIDPRLQMAGFTSRLLHVLKLAQYILLALCVAYSVRSQRHIWMLLGAMVVGFMLQAAQLGYGGVETSARPTGEEIGELRNVLSVYLVLVIGVMLGLADRVRDKLLTLVLLTFIAYGCFYALKTLSRTGYASIVVMIAGGMFFMRRKWIPIAMLSAGAVVLVFTPTLLDRFLTLDSIFGLSRDSSYSSRLDAYGHIWEVIKDTPAGISIWFGLGRGSLPLSYADTQWGIELLYGGLIGLVLMIIVTLAVWFNTFSAWRIGYKRNDALGAASVACVLALTAAVVSEFGLTSWSSIRTAEVIFLLIGLVMACHRLYDMEQKNGIDPHIGEQNPIHVRD